MFSLRGSCRRVILVWLVVASLAAVGHAAGWKAGVAKVLITPTESMWMSGYASRKSPAEGKLTDL